MYLQTTTTTRKHSISWQCAKVGSNSPSLHASLKLSFHSFIHSFGVCICACVYRVSFFLEWTRKQAEKNAWCTYLIYVFIMRLYNQCTEALTVKQRIISLYACVREFQPKYFLTNWFHDPSAMEKLYFAYSVFFGANTNVTWFELTKLLFFFLSS